MSRRSKPVNRVGCKPTEDVCVEHDMPLECRHGCKYALPHKCKDQTSAGAESQDTAALIAESERLYVQLDAEADSSSALAEALSQMRVLTDALRAFLKPRAEENSGATASAPKTRMTQSVDVASESVAGRAPVAPILTPEMPRCLEDAIDAAQKRGAPVAQSYSDLEKERDTAVMNCKLLRIEVEHLRMATAPIADEARKHARILLKHLPEFHHAENIAAENWLRAIAAERGDVEQERKP